MRQKKKLKNIFSDKATLVLRKLIREPEKKWVVRDFVRQNGVSLGMAQEILETLTLLGYVERIKKGPDSFSTLINREKLIEDWLAKYNFELNEIDSFYSPEKKILRKLSTNIDEKKYALTLHSGANLITSYVRSEHIYLYLDTKTWDKDVLEIRQQLELKELVKGGNIHFIHPFYKTSTFYNCQKIKGYRVVSNLQLYLDLYHFQPRGREHAQYLKELLEKRGGIFDQPV